MRVSMKKAISSLTIGAILVSSTALFTADAAATSIKYTKYTYATNTTSEYTLTLEEQVNVNTRDTIGSETRTPDQNDGIVKIFSGESNWRGTGFIIDDHTIATCAHDLINETQGYFPDINIGLFDEDGNLTSTRLTVIESHIASEYVEAITDSEPTYLADYDYALMTVAEDLSDRVHFELGVLPLEADDTFTANIYVTGIPQDLNHQTVLTDYNTIYTGKGNIYTASSPYGSQLLHFDTDTSNGNSGSPVYVKTSFTVGTNEPQILNTVIAIYTLGSPENIQTNAGVRITAPILQFYNNNPNISY